MALSDWFRKLFSPSPAPGKAGDEAALREEYGAEVVDQPGPMGVSGGLPGLAGLEDAQAAEDAVEADEAPPDPAP